MASIIVFGATGAVGSAAALEASARGAKVWLAMRDTSKKIPTISEEQEKQGSFQRVQADLTDPESIKKAVEKSGAKAVFIYAIFGSKDNMKSSIQALKDAGVTWTVLLSSYTVTGDLRSITQDQVIPYFHAAAEISLQEVGMPYGAVRPGYFASNDFRVVDKIKSGEVGLYYPQVKFDHIDPKNIGQVAGALVVNPESNRAPSDPLIVYLTGPQLTSQEDTALKIAKIMGKDTKIKSMTKDEWITANSVHMPGPIVQYLARNFEEAANGTGPHDEAFYNASSKNIKKYSGHEATTFDEFFEAHKDKLTS